MHCFCLTDKATHPTNRQEDWEYIIGFCDQINKELEGYVCGTHKTFSPLICSSSGNVFHQNFTFCSPQIAVTLLVHKIHSPQEWEALQALTVRNTQQAPFATEANTFFRILCMCTGIGGLYEELWEKVS